MEDKKVGNHRKPCWCCEGKEPKTVGYVANEKIQLGKCFGKIGMFEKCYHNRSPIMISQFIYCPVCGKDLFEEKTSIINTARENFGCFMYCKELYFNTEFRSGKDKKTSWEEVKSFEKAFTKALENVHGANLQEFYSRAFLRYPIAPNIEDNANHLTSAQIFGGL